MTKAELDDFHGEVSEKLRIGMPGSPIFKFDAEDLASAGGPVAASTQSF